MSCWQDTVCLLYSPPLCPKIYVNENEPKQPTHILVEQIILFRKVYNFVQKILKVAERSGGAVGEGQFSFLTSPFIDLKQTNKSSLRAYYVTSRHGS